MRVWKNVIMQKSKLIILSEPNRNNYKLQKPPREPQGYQRCRTSGQGTIANQWRGKNNVDQQAGP